MRQPAATIRPTERLVLVAARLKPLGARAPRVRTIRTMSHSSGHRLRQGVRGIILDEDDRVLLVQFRLPKALFWAFPGGGVGADETPVEALRRELIEEVGLSGVDIGPVVWTRTHIFDMGEYDGQTESIFLINTAHFAPKPEFSPEELEAEQVVGIGWWTVDDLVRSKEIFSPRRLPSLLPDLVENGPPSRPVDVGV